MLKHEEWTEHEIQEAEKLWREAESYFFIPWSLQSHLQEPLYGL